MINLGSFSISLVVVTSGHLRWLFSAMAEIRERNRYGMLNGRGAKSSEQVLEGCSIYCAAAPFRGIALWPAIICAHAPRNGSAWSEEMSRDETGLILLNICQNTPGQG